MYSATLLASQTKAKPDACNETAPENQRYIVGYYHQIHDTHVEDIAATLEETVEKFKFFVEDCQELAKYA